MNVRTTTLAGLAAAAILCLGLFFSQSTIGQSPPPPAGRYQIVVAASEGNDTIYVFEAATGQCWHRDTAPTSKWHELGSPAIRTKE